MSKIHDNIEKNNKINMFMSIRSKLISAFLVPVVLIIILGVISYNISANGFKNNYKDSTLSTMTTVADYFELGFHAISSKSLQLDATESITNYYSGAYKDDSVNEVLMQSEDSEMCLMKMSELSDKINQVSDNADDRCCG